jgi:probable HAF family extracellular repeat protein
MNNLGQVVGWSRTAVGLQHAFLWDQTGGMQDLGMPEGDNGEARAINDREQIVGVSDEEPGRPALWTPAGPVPSTRQFQSLFGFSDINRHGYTAGRQLLLDGRGFMVLWRPSEEPKKLFPLHQQIQRWPVINDANQLLFEELRWRWFEPLVRKSFPVQFEYYLWDPNHGRILLNRQVPTQRGERLELFDLNNSGCLVGRIYGPGPHIRGVLLEPILEQWGKRPAR